LIPEDIDAVKRELDPSGLTPPAASRWDDDEGEDRELGTDKTTVPSAAGDIVELLDSLPKNLHKEKEERARCHGQPAERGTDGTGTIGSPHQVLETLAEEEEEEEEEGSQAEAGLKIAWQYRKSVQQERLGGVSVDSSTRSSLSDQSGARSSFTGTTSASIFCHSYDLSSYRCTETNDWDRHGTVKIAPVSCSCGCIGTNCHIRTSGFACYHQIVQQLDLMLSGSDRRVVRLLFYRWSVCVLSVALPLLLSHIRRYELPVVVLVTVQPWTQDQYNTAERSLVAVRRCCDVVLTVEGFAGRSSETYPPPPEFRTLHGLLQIRKLNTGTAATANGPGSGHFADTTSSKRPASSVFGLKRDRRKLTIQLLHIPPEEYAEGGGSVGGGGVRSGAGRGAGIGSNSSKGKEAAGCAGAGGNASSALDF